MCRRFDVKTPASLLQSYLEVVTPAVIKGYEDIPNGIYQWEEKVVNLRAQYHEDLGENLRLAILVGMMPKEFQDMIIQNGGMMSKVTYQSSRDYVLGVANQRIQMKQRSGVGSTGVMSAEQEEREEQERKEAEANAVGNAVRCYNCQGFGHIAANCPKPKRTNFGGKGKGAKGGGGKGGGKAGGARPWNSNPSGSGYQGICWLCQKVGHKANECPQRSANEVEANQSNNSEPEKECS